MRARCFFLMALLLAFTSTSIAQQWFSVQTDHLISYSEGNDLAARDAAKRSEQLIAVFGQVFHRKDIGFATPLRLRSIHSPQAANGATEDSVLVTTPAANFVTVDLSQPESWAQGARAIGALILEDNYPRAQPWFDSGIASYLAGVQFKGDQLELGSPPHGMVLPHAEEWIPLAKLFEANELTQIPETQRATFEAESWALVRWLIDNSRLAQAGTYLNVLQSRGATPEHALAEAFSTSSDELDHEVHASLAKLTTTKIPAPQLESALLKSQKVSVADAYVLQANLSLFGPDSSRTLNELIAFMRQNQENAYVHRSLAWAFLLRGDLDNAVEHIRRALALDDSDPAMHYLYARWVNQGKDNEIRLESAESRMGTELKAALKRDPNYAAALELLGLAELNDGNSKSALGHLQRASALRPRVGRYYLNQARAYEATGNLEAARRLILYARAGGNTSVTDEAGELLKDLGKQKKRQQQWEALGLRPDPNAKPSKYDNLQDAIAEDERAEAKSKSPEPVQDTRKVEFMKGRIVSVECSSTPNAIIHVSSGGSTWTMYVADRTTAVLIGAEHFDCNWHNDAVSINFKRSGNLKGDLVSLEVN